MDTVTDPKRIASDLNELIEFEYDAIAAYQAAVDRLENPAFKTKLGEFLNDHKQHAEELSSLVRRQGETPEKDGDAKKLLTKGKVVLADAVGDKAILMAMKANEVLTNKTYATLVERGYAPEVQAALQKSLADEKRHKAWLDSTLDAL